MELLINWMFGSIPRYYKLRIIFENLAENGFLLRPLHVIFSTRRKWTPKHGNLLEYLIKHGHPIYILIDNKPKKRTEFRQKAEIMMTCVANDIPTRNVFFVRGKDIRKDDILITYISDLMDGTDHGLTKINCYKVLDMNHFYARIPQLRQLPLFDCLISESDIFSDSKLLTSIRYYKNHNYEICIKPYSYEERFVKKKKFAHRKNKAVATGTYEILKDRRYAFFIKTYQTDCLHPMRRSIYLHKNEWEEYIDSKITCFPDDDLQEIENGKGKIYTWLQKKKNEYRQQHLTQNKYLSFSMVDLYNDYKMAVVPEEITGMPAIGFVEAMACGCAFIGVKDRGVYEKLGMEAGRDYIGYDGTDEDLIKKISYYQNHGEELEKVAQNGYRFALEHFNRETVAMNFYKEIRMFAKKRLKAEREV